MSNFVLSPNMSLEVPTVGVEAGPLYAQDLNVDLYLIDDHNHTPGKGAPIPLSALSFGTLTADLNFGSAYGLIAGYYKSASANIATTGVLRLANTDTIGFRNHANNGDYTLGMDGTGSDYLKLTTALKVKAAGALVNVSDTAPLGSGCACSYEWDDSNGLLVYDGFDSRNDSRMRRYFGTGVKGFFFNILGADSTYLDTRAWSFTGTLTSGNNTVTNVPPSIVSQISGVSGCLIYGTGIPTWTSVTSASGTSIVMSKNATTNGATSLIVQDNDCGNWTFGKPQSRVGVDASTVNIYAPDNSTSGVEGRSAFLMLHNNDPDHTPNRLAAIVWDNDDSITGGVNVSGVTGVIVNDSTEGSQSGGLILWTVNAGARKTAINIPKEGNPSFPNGILGTTTNNDAPAGCVGEEVAVNVTSLSNIPSASGAYGDLTSIALSAGDWDVSAIVYYNLDGGGAAVITQMEMGISTTTGNSGTGLQPGVNDVATPYPPTSVSGITLTIPAYRMSLSGSTTVYLKCFATYTTATPRYRCRISARRVR